MPEDVFSDFHGEDAPSDQDMYRCVHCGLCLSACPTYMELGVETESPRGRIALMKAVNEGRLNVNSTVMRHWDLCIQCRACEVACPSGVPYGRLMESTRASVAPVIRRTKSRRLAQMIGFQWVLPHPRILKKLTLTVMSFHAPGICSNPWKSGA